MTSGKMGIIEYRLILRILFRGEAMENIYMRSMFAVLLTLAVVSGCASYQQPSATEPHATATFQRSAATGGNVFSQGRLLSFFIASNDECSEAPRAAFFGTGDFSGDRKKVRVRTDDALKVLAFLEVNDAGGAPYQRTGQTRCTSEASFTSTEGQSYFIGLETMEDDSQCSITIIEEESGNAPTDLLVGDDVCSGKPDLIPD